MNRIADQTRSTSAPLAAALLVFFAHITAAQAADVPAANDQPAVLGIEATHFKLNGQPTFLLGISYYTALGAPEESIRSDLDDMQRYGFNWLRVWAGGHDLGEQEVREALQTIGLDFLSLHRPRTPGSPAQTEARTGECLELTASLEKGYESWQ